MTYPKAEWDLLAVRRARRILERERVMSTHMLESKISEAGPRAPLTVNGPAPPGSENMRAEPPHVTHARQVLIDEGFAVPIPTTTVASWGIGQTGLFVHHSLNLARPSAADQQRLDDVVAGYKAWLAAVRDQARCGHVLEDAVDRAANSVTSITVIGAPRVDLHVTVAGCRLGGKYDNVLAIGKDVVVVEDKNLREWLYPRRKEVWQLIRRCLDSDEALPLLVTRKVPPAMLTFCQAIGALAFQTNNPVFRADVKDGFDLVVSKRGLNFFDIRFDTAELERRLGLFIGRTVSRVAADRRRTFRDVATILRDYAYAQEVVRDGLDEAMYQELRHRLCLDIPF